MATDEELTKLDEAVRRLKIEYDVYFNGGSKRPPTDTEWRVHALLRRFADSPKLTYPQRFRYNAIAQRYAIFSDLWRQKLKIKEEGFRRPADAVLAIQGLRTEQERQATQPRRSDKPFTVACADVDREDALVRSLYDAMLEARRKAGDNSGGGADFEQFKAFLRKKTAQIRSESGAPAVEYSVELDHGQVRLKAKPRK